MKNNDPYKEVIAVSIVEDDRDIRDSLAMIINGTPGFVCEHVYGDCESGIKGIPEQGADVVLMDINLPGKSGIEGVKKLKAGNPDIDFIMLTINDDEETIFEALCAGATGYLTKETAPQVILHSIREVYNGGSPMSANIARKVVTSFKTIDENPLTERETEILRHLCDGSNYTQIAEALFVSKNTVASHIKNIYRKLQVNSRGEVVRKAIKERLV
ncbi:MAG: response regulator transcription factor [Bacteroidales bacterium]|nr:response regulator transcription factor [Bacteroidales bacterium]